MWCEQIGCSKWGVICLSERGRPQCFAIQSGDHCQRLETLLEMQTSDLPQTPPQNLLFNEWFPRYCLRSTAWVIFSLGKFLVPLAMLSFHGSARTQEKEPQVQVRWLSPSPHLQALSLSNVGGRPWPPTAVKRKPVETNNGKYNGTAWWLGHKKHVSGLCSHR